MKNISTDVYSFEELINDNYIYIDKTKHLYQLINKTRGKQFFLSRPRRFGKSLLLSTIQCIFEVKRELFKGLYIDSADYGWQTYPVIRLDMNNTVADTLENTKRKISYQLQKNATRLGIELDDTDLVSVQFEKLITETALSSSQKKLFFLLMSTIS